ncbi:MAG: anaerobic ribonucleoside-triphosphate reductase [Candidatus Helarchaeota archaeon]|nr:anaerobic ribonucleoside-triphosphate reductase [Candidatus Helarchaeota archaeon]
MVSSDNTRLINEMLPEVRTTRMDVEKFDSGKIIDSMVRETGINRDTAEKVTTTVLKRIIQSNVQWLSGPAIREMCCSVLAEMGLLEARRRYTRIGMPLMDYEELLTEGTKENANQYDNPESIHSWAADRISSEYTLLRLLTEEQSKAHLSGDIHVHMLRYFDLRPFCQEWDLRMILRYGLPPCGWRHSAVSKPANHAMVAILHAAKWLGIVQGEFSGGQGYDNFTVFMAPYLKGLSYEDAKQLAQCFLFETNQIYAARGAQVPFTSISCLPTIPDSLLEVPAVGFGGKIDGVYGDYHDECNLFFRALCDVYCKGDGAGKLFNFPKHEIKIKREWIKKYEEEYLMVSKEAAKFGLPYYLNMMADWMPDEVHSQCCRIILTPDGIRKVCHDPDLFDWTKSFMNLGSLQSVSLNLPRYAYQARGDDDLLFQYIDKNMELAKQILIIKQDVIQRAMTHNLIPICASKLNGVPLLDFRKQSLSIGFVGLNECVQSHTGHQLHEDNATYEFGKKILRHLYKKCEEFTESNMVKFSLWEQPAESTAERFAKLDLIHYPNEAIPLGERPDYVYYTNSDHLNYAANVPLFERINKQAAFHPIVQGGVITHIWMGEAHPDAEGLWKFTKAIANTPTAYFTYTLDFTQCLNCMHFINGIYNTCPNCGATGDALEWWSRVTGYYSRVKRFNKGKFQEWHDRKRYDIAVES